MPQALSKFVPHSGQILPTPAAQKKKQIHRKRNRVKYQRKACKATVAPTPAGPRELAPVDEDWEKEIQEFSDSLEKEKEMKCQMLYDPKDELKVAANEMTLYNVPRAPSPTQEHYTPSSHHVPPVKWVRYIYSSAEGQFTDADE